MTPRDVIAHFGTQAEICRALKCAPSTVSEWVSRGQIPLGRQFQIEVITRGALRVKERRDATV